MPKRIIIGPFLHGRDLRQGPDSSASNLCQWRSAIDQRHQTSNSIDPQDQRRDQRSDNYPIRYDARELNGEDHCAFECDR
jgi:hypothetical protein